MLDCKFPQTIETYLLNGIKTFFTTVFTINNETVQDRVSLREPYQCDVTTIQFWR